MNICLSRSFAVAVLLGIALNGDVYAKTEACHLHRRSRLLHYLIAGTIP